ncbi:MAG: HEPN domain-containing protein [Chloroflexi bacterium]|nr:HEPN domain-containing protein [Chloroflexota bacterium]
MAKFELIAALGNLELPNNFRKVSFKDFTLKRCPNHSSPEATYDEDSDDIADVDWVYPDKPDLRYPVCDYYLEAIFPAQRGQGWRQADVFLAWSLTRLRLFQKGDLWGSLYKVYDTSHSGMTTGIYDIEESLKRRAKEPPSVGLLVGRATYTINKNDICKIKAFVSKIASFPISDFEIPIRRFNQSFDRDFVDDKAIDLFITLESLLSEGPESIGTKIALRAAGLIGKSSLEKQNIYSFIKKAYSKRSDLVHGVSSAIRWFSEKSFSGSKNVYEIEDITRRVLKVIVEKACKGVLLKAKDLDKYLFLG